MAGRVEGKIACVTGAANGIGRCAAISLASEGAVRLFTKAVALECAAAKDGVNSLHPGIVETAIWDSLIGTREDPSSSRPRTATLAAFTVDAVPLGRPGTPNEIASGIIWLASDESSYVTGTELVIDGGRTIG